jgi:ribosomal protein L31
MATVFNLLSFLVCTAVMVGGIALFVYLVLNKMLHLHICPNCHEMFTGTNTLCPKCQGRYDDQKRDEDLLAKAKAKRRKRSR